MDVDEMVGLISSDGQGIDEISRAWMRDPASIGEYLRGLVSMVSDLRSEVRDLHTVQWGDTAVVTCWLEQDYTMNGTAEHVSAPTTLVMRSEDGTWKLALVHSIPLPEEGGQG